MLADVRELTREEQARLLNRALAGWLLSADPAKGQPEKVTSELRQHAGGWAVVVVTAGRHEIVAWYRVMIRGHRADLRQEPLDEMPSALLRPGLPGLLSRSAVLRARSQALTDRSAHLRAQLASTRTGLAHSQKLLNAVRARITQPPAGPVTDNQASSP